MPDESIPMTMAQIYKATYELMLMAAPQELQDKVLRAAKEPEWKDPEVALFISTVANKAEAVVAKRELDALNKLKKEILDKTPKAA